MVNTNPETGVRYGLISAAKQLAEIRLETSVSPMTPLELWGEIKYKVDGMLDSLQSDITDELEDKVKEVIENLHFDVSVS